MNIFHQFVHAEVFLQYISALVMLRNNNEMLGLGFMRHPGDRAAAELSRVARWVWMEISSDLLLMSPGVLPAVGFSEGDFLPVLKRDLVGWPDHTRIGDKLKAFPLGGLIYGKGSFSAFRIVPGDLWPLRNSRRGRRLNLFWYPKFELYWRPNSVALQYKYKSQWWPKVRFKVFPAIGLGVVNPVSLFVGSSGSLMAANVGGGDKGIFIGTISHPKPTSGNETDAVILDRIPLKMIEGVVGTSDQGQEHTTAARRGSAENNQVDATQCPAVFTEGDLVEDEEDVVAVNIEDDELQTAGLWTILARFYSLRTPNQVALFDDMRRAWRLRADMSYKSLRDNMFIITFSVEGDYDFVIKGGPWIHRGDALLVASFDGITCPSNVPLDVVPIWVRIYDLPLVLMTKVRGEMFGSKLGKVREVDVGDDGRNKHDFFHIIRVDLPVKCPLKSQIAIRMTVQGKEVLRRFDLRYEWVPHFCFICGFIGHSDRDCNRRSANEDQPFQFSAELRCSPLKPFEKKISKVKAAQTSSVARNLFFRGAGSASSSSSRHKQDGQMQEAIPPRVDAHDGFEFKEREGGTAIDEMLAQQAGKMDVTGDKTQETSMVVPAGKLAQQQ